MAATAHGGTAVSGREGTCQINAAVSGTPNLKTEDPLASSRLIYRVTQWTAEESDNEFVWADSDSDGYEDRAPTRLGLTGSVTVKLDTGLYVWNIFNAGDIVALTLWVRKGVPLGFDLPRAKIGPLSWTVNPESQEPIEVSFNFGSDGAYFTPGATHAFPSLLAN